MHVSFKIHYRNNLIDKKEPYLISCPPSWDGRNYSYGHQLYPSEYINVLCYFVSCLSVQYLLFNVFLTQNYDLQFSFNVIITCNNIQYIVNYKQQYLIFLFSKNMLFLITITNIHSILYY